MGASDETKIRECLEKLPERSPDYGAMWLHIQEETASRKLGWTKAERAGEEEQGRIIGRRQRRLKGIRTSMLAAVCIALIPALVVWVSKDKARQSTPSVEVGQSIHKKSTVRGVTLTLNGAAAEQNFAGGESLMRLFVSLELKGGERYDQIIFDEELLTDLSTGEQKKLPGNSFEITTPGGSLSKLYDIYGLGALQGTRNYRLTASGLLLRTLKDIPLDRAVLAGTTYPRSSDISDLLTVHSVERNENKLIVEYTLSESGPFAGTDKEPGREDNRLELKLGSSSLKAGNTRTDGQGMHTDIFYLTGFSEQQIQRGQLHYLYMDTVNTIAGDWTIDFVADFKQAGEPSSRYALQADQQLQKQAGISLRELSLSPLQIEVFFDRKEELDIENPQGAVFGYNDVRLKVGEQTLAGQQLEPGEGEVGRNRFWFVAQEKDWSKHSMTLLLRDALIVERDLSSNWSKLTDPVKKKQSLSVELKLNNRYEIEYTYYREGNDLIVQTVVPEGISAMFGTVLRMNGKMIHADSKNSWFSADYRRRTDRFTGIPEKADLEINPGSYGYVDKSRDMMITLK